MVIIIDYDCEVAIFPESGINIPWLFSNRFLPKQVHKVEIRHLSFDGLVLTVIFFSD